MTSPSPGDLPRPLGRQRMLTTALQILTAMLLESLMGRAGSTRFPQPAPMSPLISCSVSSPALLAPCSRRVQQAAYGCPAGTTLVFLSTSTTPLSTVLPSNLQLHCGAPNLAVSPTFPRATNSSL